MKKTLNLLAIIIILAVTTHPFVNVVEAAPPPAKQYGPPSSLGDSLEAHFKLDSSPALDDKNSYLLGLNYGGNDPFALQGKINNSLNTGFLGGVFGTISQTANISATTSAFTVATWVNITDTTPSANQYIVARGVDWDAANWNSAYQLYYDYGTEKFVWKVRNSTHVDTLITSTVTITAQSWHYLVAKIDTVNNKIGLSLDGSNYVESDFYGPVNPDPDWSSFMVGNIEFFNSGTHFRGRIDELSYWTRAISHDEITALYNSGAGCAYSWTTCEPLSYLEYVKQTDALSTFPRVTGSGNTVAIIDTGIDTTDSKFSGKVLYQHDYVGNDDIANDTDGHGTHVASVIVDICPSCKLAVYKVGSSSPAAFKTVLQHIIANRAALGISVVNISLGIDNIAIVNTQVENYPLGTVTIDDEIRTLYTLNIPIVVPGGNYYFTYNSAQGLTYPATSKYVLSVGGVFFKNSGSFSDGSGAVASTSAAGRVAPFANRAQWMTILAPAVDVPVIGLGGSSETADGTSIASAIVSGAVALVQNKAKITNASTLSVDEIRKTIHDSGTQIYDGDDEDDNVTNSGAYYRVLNVLAALSKTVASVNRLRDGSFEENSAAWQRTDYEKDFGRQDSWNLESSLTFGAAQCGSAFYTLGAEGSPLSRNLTYKITNLAAGYVPEYSSFFQQFRWEGGELYYKLSAKNIYSEPVEIVPPAHPVFLTVSLTNVTDHNVSYTLLDNAPISRTAISSLSGGWLDITGTITSSVPAGDYRITFSRGNSGDSEARDVIGIDNIYVSGASITARQCDSTGIELFPTSTPGFTPTAISVPFSNCSFENGDTGWRITAPVVISDTVSPPHGTHYLYTTSSPIKASQYFNVQLPTAYDTSSTSSGGVPRDPYPKIVVQFFYKGAPAVSVKQFGGEGTIYTVLDVSQNNATPPYASDWTFVSKEILLNAAGDYELRLGAAGAYVDPLNPYSFVYSNAYYDAFTIGYNGLPPAGCGLVSPTATPTGAPTRTPTPLAYSTWTPTPRSTSTPRPSPTPNIVGGTAQPDSTGSRYADPGPGQDLCSAPLDQAQQLTFINWWIYLTQIPEWISYVGCEGIRFFQFSPSNAQTFSTLFGFSYEEYQLCSQPWFAGYIITSHNQTMLSKCEMYTKFPFGTLMEIITALKELSRVMESYNWTQASGLVDSTVTAFKNCYTSFNSDYSQCLMNWLQGLDPSDGILSGKLKLDINNNRVSSTACSINMANMFGAYATQTMCFVYNTTRDLGFMVFIQFSFDLGWLWLLVTYFQKAWISRA
jgi:hypothetical protein